MAVRVRPELRLRTVSGPPQKLVRNHSAVSGGNAPVAPSHDRCPNDRPFRQRPLKMAIGDGHQEGIVWEATEIFQLAKPLAHPICGSAHRCQFIPDVVPFPLKAGVGGRSRGSRRG